MTGLVSNVVARCRELAAITDVPGQTTRTFLSPAMRACNERVGAWLVATGARVSMDGAGNLRGFKAASRRNAKTVVIGSHLDTVPNAGAFDGILGVVLGVAIMERLRDRPLPFHLCVIGFSEEEGVRFGVPFIGSRALIGTLDEATLQVKDSQGVSIRQALQQYGVSEDLASARMTDVATYFEPHIEQGPVLESQGGSIGIVSAVVGQSRWLVRFVGRANHAGTTPMTMRADALAAAATWVSAVETRARAGSGLVATVGRFDVQPNAGNVIAGEVIASLDVRHANDPIRRSVVDELIVTAKTIASTRSVSVEAIEKLNQPAAPMDKRLTALLTEAAKSCGVDAPTLPSGAGHDAMVLAPHIPTAMLFVRSPKGLSHHPDEAVRDIDVELALSTGIAFIESLARSPL